MIFLYAVVLFGLLLGVYTLGRIDGGRIASTAIAKFLSSIEEAARPVEGEKGVFKASLSPQEFGAHVDALLRGIDQAVPFWVLSLFHWRHRNCTEGCKHK